MGLQACTTKPDYFSNFNFNCYSLLTFLSIFSISVMFFFFFQAEDGIRDDLATGVQTCALPICQNAELAKSLAGRMRDARAEVIANAGHLVFLDASDKYDTLLKDFMSR